MWRSVRAFLFIFRSGNSTEVTILFELEWKGKLWQVIVEAFHESIEIVNTITLSPLWVWITGERERDRQTDRETDRETERQRERERERERERHTERQREREDWCYYPCILPLFFVALRLSFSDGRPVSAHYYIPSDYSLSSGRVYFSPAWLCEARSPITHTSSSPRLFFFFFPPSCALWSSPRQVWRTKSSYTKLKAYSVQQPLS